MFGSENVFVWILTVDGGFVIYANALICDDERLFVRRISTTAGMNIGQ